MGIALNSDEGAVVGNSQREGNAGNRLEHRRRRAEVDPNRPKREGHVRCGRGNKQQVEHGGRQEGRVVDNGVPGRAYDRTVRKTGEQGVGIGRDAQPLDFSRRTTGKSLQ